MHSRRSDSKARKHGALSARIKVLLLSGAGVGKEPERYVESPGERAEFEEIAPPPRASEPAPASGEKVALAPLLWMDPDVRWLCGIHESEGHLYLIRERYEELLWWLQLPALLRLAGESAPSRAAVAELSKTVESALASAKAANYRIDELVGDLADAVDVDAGEPAATDAEAAPAMAPKEHGKRS